MSKETTNKAGTFEFHGVTAVRTAGNQLVCACPFCSNPDHFYFNPGNGLWDCKSCGKGGNPITFLAQLHELYFNQTTVQHYKLLARMKSGIPFQEFRDHGLAFDGARWYLPANNLEGKFANLHVWDGEGQKVIGSTGMAMHLIDGEKLAKSTGPVYVCEGFWDTFSFNWMLNKLKEPGVVVGVPGAAVFKTEWIEALKGREVYLLYDADNAGQNGMQRAANELSKGGCVVYCLNWPSNTPEGYDVRDCITQYAKSPKSAWKTILGLCEKVKGAKGEAEKEEEPKAKTAPYGIDKVIKTFRKHLHLDKNMEDALVIMFAAVLSSQIPGDPIWLFVVGPPGAGKTAFLRSLETTPDCNFQSSLTPHLLVSGFIPHDGEDPSLLAKLTNKCLVLKDYTEIKSMPITVQEEIYGTLRGAYDGKVQRTFGNGITREFNDCYFSMVAGVTHVIHGDTRATLGERFLKYQLLRGGHDNEKHIRAAITGMHQMHEAEKEIHETVRKFLHREVPKKLPVIPSSVVERIVPLSQVIAFLRAGVERHYGSDLVYRPEPEIGTRLAKQLIKLGQCIALVLGLPKVDEHCYELMERIAFDTALGWNLDIVHVLMRNYPNHVIRPTISETSNISESSILRKLEDLMELKIVERERIKVPGITGQPPWGYRICKRVANLWKRAKISQAGTVEARTSQRRNAPKSKPKAKKGT